MQCFHPTINTIQKDGRSDRRRGSVAIEFGKCYGATNDKEQAAMMNYGRVMLLVA